jgi:hypothetical protein
MTKSKVECLETPPPHISVNSTKRVTSSGALAKRKIDVHESPRGRKERQAKYTKKTRNAGVFERFVRDSVGLESITSGVRNKPLRLFDICGFTLSCSTLQGEYDRGKEKKVWTDYQKHAFDGIGTIGYGVASPGLMTNLLQDLRGRTPTGMNKIRLRRIQPEVGKKETDKADYAFFHWDKLDSSTNGVITDYCTRENILSKRSVKEIDDLGFGICRVLFPGKFDKMDDVEMQDHILLLPGVVVTRNAHNQGLHLDDKPGEILFLLHFPLCEEGMLLRVFDESNGLKAKSNFLRIPFGSYAITRGDVYHAGIYGNTGNCRFHMVIKTAGKFLASDKLHRFAGDVKPPDNAWKNVMYKEDDLSRFSKAYLQLLMEKSGHVLDEEWVRNLI